MRTATGDAIDVTCTLDAAAALADGVRRVVPTDDGETATAATAWVDLRGGRSRSRTDRPRAHRGNPPIGVPEIARGARAGTFAGKGEKALLAAVAEDDLVALEAIAPAFPDVTAAATVLFGLRLADIEPSRARDLLGWPLSHDIDLARDKFLRRHFDGLRVCVVLAPGVEATFDLGAEALALAVAEMSLTLDDPGAAVEALAPLPATAPVRVARADASRVAGEPGGVLAATDTGGGDPVLDAVAGVLRGWALAAQDRLDEAEVVFGALAEDDDLEPRVRTRALLAWADVAVVSGHAAEALDARRRATALDPSLDVVLDEEPTVGGGPADALVAARARVARKLRPAGRPGDFGGRHHSTYGAEVAEMLATGRADSAEGLILGLLDAAEDEADGGGGPVEATLYLTLADAYAAAGDSAGEQAVLERFVAARERAGTDQDPAVSARLEALAGPARRTP